MARIAVVFASLEGQTQKIAQRIGQVLQDFGHEVDVHDCRDKHLDLGKADGIIVGGSVHVGTYQDALARFITRNVETLQSRPNAFYSVSITAASENAADQVHASDVAHSFLHTCGWAPQRVEMFAGALPFSRYNAMKKVLMKSLASGLDTSVDYEYTDWSSVNNFAEAFVKSLATQRCQMPHALHC